MNGIARIARGRAGLGVAVWLAGVTGCIQVPEPVELEMTYDEDVDVFVAPPAPTPRPAPSGKHDYAKWPLSSDPRLAELGQRELRTYPLWPTPIDRPCPEVMFGRFEPKLDAGPTLERVRARLATVVDPWLHIEPSEITRLRDHVDVPGLQLWDAWEITGSCATHWTHTYCFVDSTDAYCPDGTASELERLVRAYRLRPSSLSSAGWFELAVVMVGVDYVVIEPELVQECSFVEGVEALAPAVEREPERVTVRFTSIAEGGRGVDHTVIVEGDGGVTMEARERWHAPTEAELQRALASEAAGG